MKMADYIILEGVALQLAIIESAIGDGRVRMIDDCGIFRFEIILHQGYTEIVRTSEGDFSSTNTGRMAITIKPIDLNGTTDLINFSEQMTIVANIVNNSGSTFTFPESIPKGIVTMFELTESTVGEGRVHVINDCGFFKIEIIRHPGFTKIFRTPEGGDRTINRGRKVTNICFIDPKKKDEFAKLEAEKEAKKGKRYDSLDAAVAAGETLHFTGHDEGHVEINCRHRIWDFTRPNNFGNPKITDEISNACYIKRGD